MELILSAQSLEGYEYQAAIEGITLKEIITRRAEGQGQTYYQYKQQAVAKEIGDKIAIAPEAFVQAVDDIYAVKKAELDALKPKPKPEDPEKEK